MSRTGNLTDSFFKEKEEKYCSATIACLELAKNGKRMRYDRFKVWLSGKT